MTSIMERAMERGITRRQPVVIVHMGRMENFQQIKHARSRTSSIIMKHLDLVMYGGFKDDLRS